MAASPAYRRVVGIGTAASDERYDTIGISRRSAILRLTPGRTFDPITAWNLGALSWLMYDHAGNGAEIERYFGALRAGLGSTAFDDMAAARRDFALASLRWTFAEQSYGPLPQGVLRVEKDGYRASRDGPFVNFIDWHKGTQFAVATCESHTIIAFCGSELPKSLKDCYEFICDWYLTDSLVVFSEPAWAPGTRFHSGFLDRINELTGALDVSSLLALKRHDNSPRPVFLTGHSLGGALATVLACRIVAEHPSAGPQIHLYTHGQPRVCDEAAADRFGSAFGSYHRVRYRDDLITELPPSGDEHQWLRLIPLLGRLRETKLDNLEELRGVLEELWGVAAGTSVKTPSSSGTRQLYAHFGSPIMLTQDAGWTTLSREVPEGSDRLGLSSLRQFFDELESAYDGLDKLVGFGALRLGGPAWIAAKGLASTAWSLASFGHKLAVAWSGIESLVLDHTRYRYGEPRHQEAASKESLLGQAQEFIRAGALAADRSAQSPALLRLEGQRWESEWNGLRSGLRKWGE